MKILSLSIQVIILSSAFNLNLLCANKRRPPKTPKKSTIGKRALLRENTSLRQQLELASARHVSVDILDTEEKETANPHLRRDTTTQRARSASADDHLHHTHLVNLTEIARSQTEITKKQQELEATKNKLLEEDRAFRQEQRKFNLKTRRISYLGTGFTVLYATTNFIWAHLDTIGAYFSDNPDTI